MELSNKIAILCLAIGLPQGFVAVRELYMAWKRHEKELRDGAVASGKGSPVLASLSLLVCVVVAVWLGAWMYFDKPLRPVTKTAVSEKVVEKIVPCPLTQQKTGPATARGRSAIAHSGNNDTYGKPQ